MASLVENANRIQTDKEAIRQAIIAKGVEVAEDVSLDDYAGLIEGIQNEIEITERILWENPSPTKSFSSQTVTLSEDVTDKRVLIYSKSVHSGTYDFDNISLYCWTSTTNMLGGRGGSYSLSGRKVSISGNSVEFGAGQAAGGNGAIYSIPVKITVL